MKAFVTTAKTGSRSAIDGAEPIEFEIDGQKVTARPPTPGQMALAAAAEASGSFSGRAAAMIDLLDAMFDKAGSKLLRRRLMDGDDDFDLDNVQEIIAWLFEEWTARPTGSS